MTVDPVSLSAITTAVTAAAGSVGTEAGRQVWGSLADLARRAVGRGRGEPAAEPVALPLDPADGEQVRALAALLFAGALRDPRLAEEFRTWAAEARCRLPVDNSSVTNTVSGQARVGTLIQGRDIDWTPGGPTGTR
ncbi:hypothetical protein [Streptomyces albireticuli]|uniref:Uncharacterized protein n=1 Tax=Streptomyces albireticuli TaxID=1940 RepID=A0A2A2DFE6_9ACTN|nr:hypothetical protein [Streptomyces albireticuli]MCD9141108.1 hypothetical protein [Streptomyces albireticuli]MCD9160931.1 hypothetical protein [Streptomyces albireticuli]MCD9191012.1 hypothetical protein [Streptomyces albireticuli]PAU50211.1 hypothetical protein CK936_03705 [Streptomyces albireticuli]